MRIALIFPLLLAVPGGASLAADPIYKWVDGAGRVNYSSTPPPGAARVDKVKTTPAPSEADVRQAEEQAKKTGEQASELEKQRREQEAREAEEARLRALQRPPETIVIEQPVYVPQPIYYPPPHRPHPPHPPVKPPPRPPVGPGPSPVPH